MFHRLFVCLTHSFVAFASFCRSNLCPETFPVFDFLRPLPFTRISTRESAFRTLLGSFGTCFDRYAPCGRSLGSLSILGTLCIFD